MRALEQILLGFCRDLLSSTKGLVFGVWQLGLGLGIVGSRVVWDLGFRGLGRGCRDWGLRFLASRYHGLGFIGFGQHLRLDSRDFGVWGLGFRVSRRLVVSRSPVTGLRLW